MKRLLNELAKFKKSKAARPAEPPPFFRSLEEKELLRIVRLKGPMDINTLSEIEAFRQKMKKRKTFKYKSILLDFKEVTRIDTAAIAGILNVMNELNSTRHRLGIINAQQGFFDMLKILKLQKMILTYSTEAEAIKDLNQ